MARILIVDDEELARFTVREILHSNGHETVEAESVVAAFGKINEQSFDMVVTDLILSQNVIDEDVLMPEKESIEAIIEIKQRFPKTKVIAISGGGKMTPTEFHDIARKFGGLNLAKKHGADAIIAKPFSAAELLSRVNGLLEEGNEKPANFE